MPSLSLSTYISRGLPGGGGVLSGHAIAHRPACAEGTLWHWPSNASGCGEAALTFARWLDLTQSTQTDANIQNSVRDLQSYTDNPCTYSLEDGGMRHAVTEITPKFSMCQLRILHAATGKILHSTLSHHQQVAHPRYPRGIYLLHPYRCPTLIRSSTHSLP